MRLSYWIIRGLFDNFMYQEESYLNMSVRNKEHAIRKDQPESSLVSIRTNPIIGHNIPLLPQRVLDNHCLQSLFEH